MNEILERTEFRINGAIPPLEEVAELYLEAGWIKPGDDTGFLHPMLEHSFAVSAAFRDGKLVGMMRALSDGVSDAYILDLVVRKPYRGNGIARRVMENLTAHLQTFGIDWIVCIGAPGTEAFYSRTSAAVMHGFTPMRFGERSS